MSQAFQDKLFHYEAPPPAGAWDRLASALDEGDAQTLAQRLAAFEQAPPSGSWHKIEQALETPVRTIQPSLYRRLGPARLAAAAVFVLAIGASIFYFSRPGTETVPLTAGVTQAQRSSNLPAPVQTAPETRSIQLTPDTQTPEQPTLPGNRPRSDNQAEAARPRPLPASVLSSALAYASAEETFDEGALIAELPRTAHHHEVAQHTVPPDRYLVYSKDEGHAVRLTKKVFNLIACDAEDLYCQQQLRQLQQRIAATAPMSADFTGMMEMLRRLGENQ